MGVGLALVHPDVFVGEFDDSGSGFTVFGGQTVLPDAGVLDQMVVHRHDLMVILQWHSILPQLFLTVRSVSDTVSQRCSVGKVRTNVRSFHVEHRPA